ncbi:hypothetical protein [Sporolactobacillus terrae]|uniref:Uncharacterized protein n=1 Tax=Sporolactobacillus terrae TaxID=269673 RepID=A0A5K7WUR5_9BACL|nr:hypothetical protein [Sporolactobacillus terrae]UAK16781.1 hypothetical protein K7399_02110 [Sporolactobacillus terrae]BBN98265.1 hypothetical protein St703_09700 [Sporolactobacillus terrae]
MINQPRSAEVEAFANYKGTFLIVKERSHPVKVRPARNKNARNADEQLCYNSAVF